jgi:hypothetical protein
MVINAQIEGRESPEFKDFSAGGNGTTLALSFKPLTSLPIDVHRSEKKP